ncbi:unnamed protein product [Ceutorhynchus assimilis]|uniref:ZAD domain-containing protein n=1 Tax=Ceutorhynchus assimilis TaxID=467358 RepID=A0A9P0DH62_9CUCU|nr:unnamed protein product [Ceutorhynchus assimilis]
MASLQEIALLCRLCTDNKQVNVPIFEDHSDKKVFLKINACLPVKVSKEDQLPKKICDICWNRLDLFYKFQNTSSDAEKTLSSWLAQASQKDDYLTSDALTIAANPIENLIKVETEEKPYLDLAQHSSIDEEAEEPPAKRPRRSAAAKALINIAPESDEEDEDEPNDDSDPVFAPESNNEDEGEVKEDPDTVFVVESDDEDDQMMDEPDTVDADAVVKQEDDSEEDCKPGTSALDQPGPSGLCQQGADEP